MAVDLATMVSFNILTNGSLLLGVLTFMAGLVVLLDIVGIVVYKMTIM